MTGKIKFLMLRGGEFFGYRNALYVKNGPFRVTKLSGKRREQYVSEIKKYFHTGWGHWVEVTPVNVKIKVIK